MTYRELFYKATRLINKNEITLGEYEEMTKPFDREVEQEPILDKIIAEIEKQEKWLLQAGYNAYNVDIAFNSIKLALAESEDE